MSTQETVFVRRKGSRRTDCRGLEGGGGFKGDARPHVARDPLYSLNQKQRRDPQTEVGEGPRLGLRDVRPSDTQNEYRRRGRGRIVLCVRSIY